MKSLSPNALRILEDRYFIQDSHGKIRETPEKLFERVSKSISIAELKWGGEKDRAFWENCFFDLMSNLDFLPNSTTLMNAGVGSGQLSSCFVLPIHDSLSSIYDTLKLAALVQQKGGGTGFNFSELRPKGDRIGTHGGTSSGPVSFIELYNFSTGHIKQGGKRLGANMGILKVDHPDIFEFLRLGATENPLRHFNLSVGISDKFMECLYQKGKWALIHPRTKKLVMEVDAAKLWEALVSAAWNSGNPGLVFLDTINRSNPVPQSGKIQSTNPCGEVPLLPFESCNLGSINLSNFVKFQNGVPSPDWQRLEQVIPQAIRFLDDGLEVNQFPFSKIKNPTLSTRKIGLGLMGWADFLIQMEIPYASVQAVILAKHLMGFIQEKSDLSSRQLAIERGCFPGWKNSVFYPSIPRRNATVNSIAPTGTISMIANTSSSIEPLFGLAFERREVLGGQTLESINPKVIDFLSKKGLLSKPLLKHILQHGSCSSVPDLDEKTKNLLLVAHEIKPEWHLQHQAAFQSYTDNAVSKTINLSVQTSISEVDWIFRQAWEMRLKGITVIREGTGQRQFLYKGFDLSEKRSFLC